MSDALAYKIVKAKFGDAPIIKNIAYKVWPIAYGEILSQEQLHYMLNEFYSIEALMHDLRNTSKPYYIAYSNTNEPIAFLGLIVHKNYCKVNRIYVLPNQQGAGLGKQLMHLAYTIAKQNDCKHITLNVNKYNKALNFYANEGFTIKEAIVIDIGQGYIMDDYVLEKLL
jgi:diamine N-acetyltransferase